MKVTSFFLLILKLYAWTSEQPDITPINVSHGIGNAVAADQDGSVVIIGTWGNDTSDPTYGGGMASIYRYHSLSHNHQLETQLWPSSDFDFGGDYANTGAVVISADGSSVLVGVINDNQSVGATWLFEYDSGTQEWIESFKFVGSGSIGGAQQGYAVARSPDGNTVVIGGPFDNYELGSVWIFTYNSSSNTWEETIKLTSPHDCTTCTFGAALAFSQDGSILAIGEPRTGDDPNWLQGSVNIYTLVSSVWTLSTSLTPSDVTSFACFGTSITFSSNRMIVGAPGDSANVGAIWTYNPSNWSQTPQKLTQASGRVTWHQFGMAVAFGNNTLVVSAPYENYTLGCWHSYSWNSVSSSWTHFSYDAATDYVDEPLEGMALAISSDGSTVVLGAAQDVSGRGSAWIFV